MTFTLMINYRINEYTLNQYPSHTFCPQPYSTNSFFPNNKQRIASVDWKQELVKKKSVFNLGKYKTV